MFPKNAWYVACTPHEIDDKPLGRRVCDERSCSIAAPKATSPRSEDFCPHRGAPLSLGRVCEGKLVCGYHGLEMGCDGKTIAMPGQRVRGFPPIRAYPVGRAPRLRLGLARRRGAGRRRRSCHRPRNGLDEPGLGATAAACSTSHCDYRLMIDNLMDLTHETYVHADQHRPEGDRRDARRRRRPKATR